MSKKLVSCILIVMIIAFGGCQTKEQQKVVTEEPLGATEELFLYEGTIVDSKTIAVDEEGYLYTATCITKIEDIVMVDGVIEPVEQQFQVYDLEGTLVREAKVRVGTGDKSTYTDIPFIKGVYEVYKEGALFFRMDSEVYADMFWDYLEGTMELEEMIEEIERKKEIYLGE